MAKRTNNLKKDNSLKVLNETLFKAIERLDDDSISNEQMLQEVARTKAISDASKVVIQTVKVKIDIAKLKGGKKILSDIGLSDE